MIFKSEYERRKHQLAGRIPEHIWRSTHFYQGFNEHCLSRLILPIDETMSSLTDKEKESLNASLYCLIAGHPHATDSELLAAASRLGFTPEQIATIAIPADRLDLYKAVLREYPTLLQSHAHELFLSSVHSGNIELINFVEECLPEGITIDALIRANSLESFNVAAMSNHPEMLDHLIQKATLSSEEINACLTNSKYEIFSMAAEVGHVWTLIKLGSLAQCTPGLFQDMLGNIGEKAFKQAAYDGYAAVARYFYDNIPKIKKEIDGMLAETKENLKILQKLPGANPIDSRWELFHFVYALPILVCFNRNEDVRALLQIKQIRDEVLKPSDIHIPLLDVARHAGNFEMTMLLEEITNQAELAASAGPSAPASSSYRDSYGSSLDSRMGLTQWLSSGSGSDSGPDMGSDSDTLYSPAPLLRETDTDYSPAPSLEEEDTDYSPVPTIKGRR